MDILKNICLILIVLVALKTLLVGDFSIALWIKYGYKYSDWHKQRETFKEYIKRSY